MSELTAGQLEDLRRELLRLRAEIETALTSGGDSTKPVELDQPIGRLSRMDAIQQQQMARATRDGLDLRRQQINAALAAIDGGTYGTCKRCEEEIDFPRLRARPETPLCLDCQSEIEQR